MVISQPPGNNPSYYYRASPTLPQLLWMLPETHMFYTCNYNIRVTHESSAIKHISHTNQIHRIINRLFFIHFVAPCACLHLAVKILPDLPVWRFEHVSLTYICRLYFPPECQQDPHFVTLTILLSENILIFVKNHQQNTRRSDQIETIKTIMQTTRPRITRKVLPMAQVAIF